MIVLLFGFSTICNAAIIEMHFDEGTEDYQSFEFDSELIPETLNGIIGDTVFTDTMIDPFLLSNGGLDATLNGMVEHTVVSYLPHLNAIDVSGLYNSFMYYLIKEGHITEEGDIREGYLDEKLTSWNYKTNNVPIPSTFWLFGSVIVMLVSKKKFKKP